MATRRGITLGAFERRPGDPGWHNEVYEAVKRCRLVVAILSPAWLTSAPCAYELGLARGLGRDVLALTRLHAALAVSRLPSVIGADGVHRVDADGSLDCAIEAIDAALARAVAPRPARSQVTE